MIENKITKLELSSIVYFITKFFLVSITFNYLLKSTNQNCWMIPLFGIPIGIIFILLIIYIMNYKTNLNFGKKIKTIFNKNNSFIVINIVNIIFLFYCILNFLYICNFLQSQFLIKTPFYIIAIIISFTSLYILFKGFNTISRTSNILLYISIVFFIVTLISLIPSIKINNIKPFFNLKVTNYMDSLNTFFAFNICPSFLLMALPKNKINDSSFKKTIIFTYILSSITMFLIFFITISTFGYKLATIYEYPLFHILKHGSTFGYRIESILIMQLIFDFFICHILLIYFITSNLNSCFNTKNDNFFYIVISIIVIIISLFLSRYSFYLDVFLKLIIPLILTIIITIIIIIICIKIKMSKR